MPADVDEAVELVKGASDHATGFFADSLTKSVESEECALVGIDSQVTGIGGDCHMVVANDTEAAKHTDFVLQNSHRILVFADVNPATGACAVTQIMDHVVVHGSRIQAAFESRNACASQFVIKLV